MPTLLGSNMITVGGGKTIQHPCLSSYTCVARTGKYLYGFMAFYLETGTVFIFNVINAIGYRTGKTKFQDENEHSD